MYKDHVSLTVVKSLTSQNKCVNAMFLSEEKLNMLMFFPFKFFKSSAYIPWENFGLSYILHTYGHMHAVPNLHLSEVKMLAHWLGYRMHSP